MNVLSPSQSSAPRVVTSSIIVSNHEAEVGQKFKFKGNSMNIHQLLKLLLVEKKSDGQLTGENRYLMNIHQRSRWIFILIIAKKLSWLNLKFWSRTRTVHRNSVTPYSFFSQLVRQLTSHMCILPYIQTAIAHLKKSIETYGKRRSKSLPKPHENHQSNLRHTSQFPHN